MELTPAEMEVYDWIDSCPTTNESYKDKEGNIIIVVTIEDD